MSATFLHEALEQTDDAVCGEFGRKHLWTREEVYRAMAAGVFGGEPVDKLNMELLEGTLYEKHTGRKHLWTREEVYRAMAGSVFRGKPTDRLKMELLEGELYEIMPMKRPHANAIDKSRRVIEKNFGDTHYVSDQKPIQVGSRSEPEPDLAVISGTPDDYADSPPADAVRLVFEAANTSQYIDRGNKARIYAKAHIPEYWILILKNRTLEVRRDPAPSQENAKRWEYRDIKIYKEMDSVTPLHAPDAIIKVADLLPRIKNTPTEG